mmetsp:Transcript_2357/g.6673  ORF Transcript_2357/g.6673 Transcript_2357/m.6673 type:complete len:615 (+) Transcript_2357:981-2825(+)
MGYWLRPPTGGPLVVVGAGGTRADTLPIFIPEAGAVAAEASVEGQSARAPIAVGRTPAAQTPDSILPGCTARGWRLGGPAARRPRQRAWRQGARRAPSSTPGCRPVLSHLQPSHRSRRHHLGRYNYRGGRGGDELGIIERVHRLAREALICGRGDCGDHEQARGWCEEAAEEVRVHRVAVGWARGADAPLGSTRGPHQTHGRPHSGGSDRAEAFLDSEKRGVDLRVFRALLLGLDVLRLLPVIPRHIHEGEAPAQRRVPRHGGLQAPPHSVHLVRQLRLKFAQRLELAAELRVAERHIGLLGTHARGRLGVAPLQIRVTRVRQIHAARLQCPQLLLEGNHLSRGDFHLYDCVGPAGRIMHRGRSHTAAGDALGDGRLKVRGRAHESPSDAAVARGAAHVDAAVARGAHLERCAISEEVATLLARDLAHGHAHAVAGAQVPGGLEVELRSEYGYTLGVAAPPRGRAVDCRALARACVAVRKARTLAAGECVAHKRFHRRGKDDVVVIGGWVHALECVRMHLLARPGGGVGSGRGCLAVGVHKKCRTARVVSLLARLAGDKAPHPHDDGDGAGEDAGASVTGDAVRDACRRLPRGGFADGHEGLRGRSAGAWTVGV